MYIHGLQSKSISFLVKFLSHATNNKSIHWRTGSDNLIPAMQIHDYLRGDCLFGSQIESIILILWIAS